MKRWHAGLGFAASLGFLAYFAARLVSPAGDPAGAEEILVHCGAGLRLPVERAAEGYEREGGVRVRLQYGGSQSLLAGIEASRVGDLFIPGDDPYLQKGREKGLVAEVVPLARLRVVLAVRRGNPKGIRRLEDLFRADVRLAWPNPEAAAAGRKAQEALGGSGRAQELKRRAVVLKPTVGEVANDILVGTVDAGFVWDATVAQYKGELEAVGLSELEGAEASVSAGVLSGSGHPAAALRFARYLAAPGKGREEFARAGFHPVEGDAWAEVPELLLYGGAMLRPAIEGTIRAFEAREGVRVTRVYNGCGILVAQMRAADRPDLYFACDDSFMEMVKDLFFEPREVSINQLVIAVPKGNPRGIRTLRDLGKPGLRVGVGHEKQCALGALTKETLVSERLYGEVMKNVVVQAPAGDLLINQLKTGTLDAVVAYVSNAAGSGDVLEAVPVNVPCALATQPVAVGRSTRYRRLAERLVEALLSPESRRRFEENGFRWKESP